MNIFKNFFFKVKKLIFKNKPQNNTIPVITIMESEILAAMKRIKFIEAEARRRLLEEEKKKTGPKISTEPKVSKGPKKEIPETPGAIPKPSKVKKEKPKKKQTIPHSIKTLVWNVHIGEKVAEAKCLCCRVTSISIRHFHCGHYISEKNGGDLSVSNLRPICANCNLSMGAMNMDEFIKKFGLHK